MLKLIRPLALFIMLAAMASSYHTQYGLFRSWEVDTFTSVVAPFSVDALAVICSIALGAKNVKGKGLAATVLVVTLGGSMAANFIAGATTGSRIVHAGMVLIYLMAELVSSKVGVAKAADTVTETVATEPATETPAAKSPTKATRIRQGGARGNYGPRDPERGYAPSTKRAKAAAAKASMVAANLAE